MSVFECFYPWFRVDPLSGLIAAGVVVFFLLILVYSSGFMAGRKQLFQYYLYTVLTAIVSVLAVLSNHLVLLLVFWGFLGILLYLLVAMGDGESQLAAKKSLMIVGGTDAMMMLGIGIIWALCGTFQMDQIRLSTSGSHGSLASIAYICIAIACFAKAGAMPFHSWIPDAAAVAPLPVIAYLPASLDKLLGIYLLVRLSEGMIVINPAIRVFLMLTGALTIIAAVMMALVQHNLKRLLGYHAVSQVGYMVLGIATGNPLGLVGGVFHMLNHTVYKSCLFLVGGNIEHRAKTTELDELGGLAKAMPVTYVTAFIASLSISGIPPFNGFFSKWLIYQGLIVSIGQWHSRLGIGFGVFCLVAAMVGSGLTLASFLKLMHAVFMGQASPHLPKDIREVPATMWVPVVILAVVCVIFGVFAFVLPLKIIVIPALSAYQQFGFASVIGSWLPLSATILVLAALGLGIGVVRMRGLPSPLRQDEAFVGGESQALEPATRPTGVEFYLAVEELKPLRFIYAKARGGFFDLYEQSKKIFALSKMFAYLHNGVLPTYMVWVLLGMVGLFLYLLK